VNQFLFQKQANNCGWRVARPEGLSLLKCITFLAIPRKLGANPSVYPMGVLVTQGGTNVSAASLPSLSKRVVKKWRLLPKFTSFENYETILSIRLVGKIKSKVEKTLSMVVSIFYYRIVYGNASKNVPVEESHNAKA
jgi:hypothetical protein